MPRSGAVGSATSVGSKASTLQVSTRKALRLPSLGGWLRRGLTSVLFEIEGGLGPCSGVAVLPLPGGLRLPTKGSARIRGATPGRARTLGAERRVASATRLGV